MTAWKHNHTTLLNYKPESSIGQPRNFANALNCLIGCNNSYHFFNLVASAVQNQNRADLYDSLDKITASMCLCTIDTILSSYQKKL